MPNGTLDGFNHILDFDEVFRVSAILFLRQSSRDVAAVRNLSISCCDQLLNVFVILSHSMWTTLVPRELTRRHQADDIHCAVFLPTNWSGRGSSVIALIPECITEPLNVIGRSQNVTSWLRLICEKARHEHGAIISACNTPTQAADAAEVAAPLLLGYERNCS
jgi:hypothetical protein